MTKRNEKNRPWDADRTEKISRTIKAKTARIKEERTQKTQGRPPLYKSSKAYAYKLAVYFYNCDNNIIDAEKGKTEPYTLTGLELATGMTHGTAQRYKDGTYNHIVIDNTKRTEEGFYIEDISLIYDKEKAFIYECEQNQDLLKYFNFLYDNGDIEQLYFSTIYEKARMLTENQAEKRLYIRGSVADIFTLKSKYGWQEQQTTVHRVEIATSEEAKQALEELKLLS